MDSMSDGLILTGVDGKVLYTNPGAGPMIGLPAQFLIGSHIDSIRQTLRGLARDVAEYDRGLAPVEAGKLSSWMLETEGFGSYRAIALRRFDVRDESTRIIGHGLLLRDVTHEREVDQFKTTLLGAVGHELRTPLAAIKGYASTMLQGDVRWSPGDQQHFLQTISSEADHLAQLVTNILDLSRSEAGLLPLHRDSVPLDALIESAVRRLQSPIPDLVVGLPATLSPLDVDRARVEVVLHNLLANALAYGNGRVEITAEQHDGVVTVHVADNGPGIEDEELPHIFERFYRARYGSRRRSAGTGLGLAVSKALVEAHGGAIWAESTERGTSISFSLPVSSLNGESRPVAGGREGHPAGHTASGGKP
jgi:signal transduction histidine kinase